MGPLKAGEASIWLQEDEHTDPKFLGCHSVEEISRSKGEKTLIWCKDPSGPNRFKVAGSYRGAPDAPTFTIEGLIADTFDYLERIKDQTVNIIINWSTAGRQDDFTNWDRSAILRAADITTETESGVAAREPDNQAALTYAVEMSAEEWMRLLTLTVARQVTTEAQALNDIAFSDDVGLIAVVGADAAAAATANVLRTITGGGTWAAVAADPFAADKHVMSMVSFAMTRTTTRLLAVRSTTAAAPLQVAYSDNAGVSWTLVTVGSTNAQEALGGGALFAFDKAHIWLVATGGGIYFSNNGGVSWTAQSSGTAQNLWHVHFADYSNGIVAGAGDVVLITNDGGTTWATKTTGGGDPLICAWMFDKDTAFVGVDESAANNTLYFTNDGGATWTPVVFGDSSVGEVKDIKFFDRQRGFMIYNSTAPVATLFQTRDGGKTWENLTTPTNAGLNALAVINENLFFAVGEAQGGTGVILKASNGLS